MPLDPLGNNEHSWIIIGGGMLGLTLAWRLARAGSPVTVYEGAPELGGLASAWRIGEITWDRHYHVTLLSDTWLRRLLAELGLDGEMQWKQTFTGFYSAGKHYSMSSSLEFLRFPLLGMADKLRLGHTIFRASRIRDWKELEEIPVETWLRRHSGNRTFERIWLPLLEAKLGDSYRQTSAAFIWATIQRMYAARRSGMKREMFGYLPGGYRRLLDRLVSKLEGLGVRIQCGARVNRVVADGGGLRVSLESGAQAVADRVVCTMPSPQAARVCAGISLLERQRHEAIRHQGIVCASVLLRGPLTRYYVTNIVDKGVPFTGVVDMSALVDRAEFGGAGLVYLPKYVAPEDPLFDAPDAEIRERFLTSLSAMYPAFSRNDVLDFRVSRVRHVFPIPAIGYSRKLPSIVTSVPGLFIVNSSQIVNGTLNVNQTLELADRAMPALLAAGDQPVKVAA